MEHIIELSDYLMDEYRRLDDIIRSGKYQQGLNDYDINLNLETTAEEIKAFNIAVEKLIAKTCSFINGDLLLAKNSRHDFVNDEEDGAPLLREFYTHGLTLLQMSEQIAQLKNGAIAIRKSDGKFHYIPLERILYRNDIEMIISSKNMKSNTLVEVVFEMPKGEWASAEDIEERRTEKNHYDDNLNNPYDWMRKACIRLNSEVRAKFKIDYDLFEKDNTRIRLNPKAI